MAPTVKGYKLGETIAKGCGAKVKKCIHVASGQPVAMKLLSFDASAKFNREVIDKFKKRGHRELVLAKYLKHPNVMTCYDGKEFKNHAYIVMEWMEGGNLHDYIAERGVLSEGEARRYFRQLIHGLEYCHKRLIAHRDVKPANLLLDERKEYLKIADFGTSNYLSANLTLSTYCGTYVYQAPEISNNGTNYSGPEVDVYSSGVTLYHMLYGCPSTQNFQSFRLTDTDTDTTTPDADSLIRQMTHLKADNRITIPQIKSHKWFMDGDSLFLDNHRDEVSDQGIDNNILLETVDKMKCEREVLIQSLIKGKHTEETTTYKLLKKKKMRSVDG